VRVVGSAHFGDVALRKTQSTAGWIPGPRIVAAGISFGIRGGTRRDEWAAALCARSRGRHSEVGVADGVRKVRNAVRYMSSSAADVIKICATGGRAVR